MAHCKVLATAITNSALLIQRLESWGHKITSLIEAWLNELSLYEAWPSEFGANTLYRSSKLEENLILLS